MATIKDHVFAKLVVKSRFATKAQVMECMEARNMMSGDSDGGSFKLWDVMIRKGYLTQEQLGSILEGFREKSKRLFGEIAVKWNMVTAPQLDECIEIQNSMRNKGKKAPRIGQILVSKNYLKKHQVMAILEEQKKKIAKCPTCKAQFNLSRVQKGQKFKCTQCGKVLKIFDDKENSPEELDAHGTMVKEPEPSFKKEKKPAVSDIGGYKILQKIGEDSTGLIYKAKDREGKLVALKVLSQDAAEDRKFVKELKTAVAQVKPLDHPGIKKMYEMGEADGTYFVASEYVEGESLRSILNRDGKIGVRKSLKIATNVAEALKYAHEQGVMHGDVRPSNILVSSKGDVVLSGLGLETKITDNILGIVDSGHLAPFYIAPETVLDDRETDFRADIYSLGATLYHIIAGRPPFEGQSPFEVLMRFTEDYLPPIHIYNPETPPGVAKTIEKMVAAEPDDRYHSYDELLEHLKDPTLALGSGGPSATTPPPLKEDTRLDNLARPTGGLSERPGLVLLGVGLVILFVGLVVVAIMSSGGGGPERDLEDFKKHYLEHSTRIEDLEEVTERGNELVTRYPKNKDLVRQVNEKLAEAKQKRDTLIRLEIEELGEAIKDRINHADYAKAFEVAQVAMDRHAAPDWKEAVTGVKKGVEDTARRQFDGETQRATAPIRDTPPDRLTSEIFDRAIVDLEKAVAPFESYPELRDQGKALIESTREAKQETMSKLDTERTAASSELARKTLEDVRGLGEACRYAEAVTRLRDATSRKNAAGLSVVLPADRPALDEAFSRYERMAEFVARLNDSLAAFFKAPAGRKLVVSWEGAQRTVVRLQDAGRLEVQVEGGPNQAATFEALTRADLVALAGQCFDKLGEARPNAEIGTFALFASSIVEDADQAEVLRGLALHHLGRARSLDPAVMVPSGYDAIEAEWLARFDQAFEPIRRSAEGGRWSEAVLGALSIAQTSFRNFRIWEARRQEVESVIIQGLQSTFGDRGPTTVLAFEDPADFSGWKVPLVQVGGHPDGGIARVVPRDGLEIERTFATPFERIVFLFRTGPGTGTLRFNFYDAASKKIPLSIEPSRLAVNYQTSVSFSADKPAPAPGVWHVLEFFREGDSIRTRVDLGAFDLTSPLDSRGPMQSFVRFDLEISPSSGKEDDAAGTIDLDLLMSK